MMMRSFRGISVLILTFIIVIPIYIACSSVKSTVSKDQGIYIDRIETSRNDSGTTIDIIGKDLTHYNAYQLHDKNKLIIDLPDAKFHEIPTLDDAKVGCINQIKILKFVDEERELARIEVDLSSEVYPEFKDDSNRISINLMHQDIGPDDVPSTSMASLEPESIFEGADKTSESKAAEPIELDKDYSESTKESAQEINEAKQDIDLATSESLAAKKIETEDVSSHVAQKEMNDTGFSELLSEKEEEESKETKAPENKNPVEENYSSEAKPEDIQGNKNDFELGKETSEPILPEEKKEGQFDEKPLPLESKPAEEKTIPKINPSFVEKSEKSKGAKETDVDKILESLEG
ncbi:AMIN domain-containing protein, partial [bacterium]|nr:AMIN domain-containing protein [bacterium]